MSRGWKKFVRSAEDLATPYDKVRAGFLEVALEKTRRATPLIEEGRHLRALASGAKNAMALWDIEEIRPALLTAAGLSDKAKTHITEEEDRKAAFVQMAREVLEPQGGDFADELVYRFLLTKGDSLGGAMRNFAGSLAKRKFVQRICAAIRLRGGELLAAENPDAAEKTRFLAWESRAGIRTLALDVSIPQTGTNVDAALLSCAPEERRDAMREDGNFLALGELKGGIDPAGADEHWKTASHALERIRRSFADAENPPGLFFIGAAIERRMAGEIYERLRSGEFAFAANLTNDRQLSAACEWLTTL